MALANTKSLINKNDDSPKKRNQYRLIEKFKRDYQLWIMLLPAILVIFIFNYIPMYGIQLAFRNYDFTKGLTGGDFAGLKYFKLFFDSPMFFILLKNTFIISFFTILVGFPIPIFLALLLNQVRIRWAKKGLQTLVYAPHFISLVVMVGLLNIFLSPNTGLIGKLITAMGFDGVNLLADTRAFVPVYVLSDVWQHAGWNSIIYLAALSSVDTQLYDAARIDGANRWQIIRYVELPTLVPTMIILLILNMGGILNTGFEKIFLMQNTRNLPVSEVISTYVYKIGILSSQFSYSTAIGLFNTLINFIFLVATNALARRYSDSSLW